MDSPTPDTLALPPRILNGTSDPRCTAFFSSSKFAHLRMAAAFADPPRGLLLAEYSYPLTFIDRPTLRVAQ